MVLPIGIALLARRYCMQVLHVSVWYLFRCSAPCSVAAQPLLAGSRMLGGFNAVSLGSGVAFAPADRFCTCSCTCSCFAFFWFLYFFPDAPAAAAGFILEPAWRRTKGHAHEEMGAWFTCTCSCFILFCLHLHLPVTAPAAACFLSVVASVFCFVVYVLYYYLFVLSAEVWRPVLLCFILFCLPCTCL